MIVTDCNITVNGDGQSVASKDIYLYRGDYNVQVTFTITQANDYRYRSSDAGENLLDGASYAQIAIKNGDTQGIVVLSDIEPTQGGKVTLTILKEHIDEIPEVGIYDYQIRLFSDDQQARLTIPPVVGQLIVREPLIFGETDANIVNFALVDHAMVLRNADGELVVFDEEGNYVKTEWYGGDVISAERLNKIEDALFQIKDSSITEDDAGDILTILQYINNSDDELQTYYDETTENLTISGSDEVLDDGNITL